MPSNGSAKEWKSFPIVQWPQTNYMSKSLAAPSKNKNLSEIFPRAINFHVRNPNLGRVVYYFTRMHVNEPASERTKHYTLSLRSRSGVKEELNTQLIESISDLILG
jgi:hypothetical protein